MTSHLHLGIVHHGVFTPQPLANATHQDFVFFFFFPKEPVSQYRAEATFPGSARIQASATVPATQIVLDNLDFGHEPALTVSLPKGPAQQMLPGGVHEFSFIPHISQSDLALAAG